MMRSLYRLLENPFLYRLLTGWIGPGGSRLRKPYYEKAYGHSAGRVLDLGCGPFLTTPEPNGLLVGVDINESYLRTYTGGFLDEDPDLILNPPDGRRRLGYCVPADRLVFDPASFDEARSSSFFHHLNDEAARMTLKQAFRCLKPGGRLVIFEDVWPKNPWLRPLAWLIRRFDRGAFMRGEEELLSLFQQACPGPWKWERFTYTYTGMECLYLEYVKP